MAIRQTVYSIFLVSVIADGMREVEESLKDVHEACQAEIDALAANFLSQPVTPLAAFAFEQALQEILQEAGREVMERVLNACEPESPDEASHDVTLGSAGYRRRNEKTRNPYVETTFGRITLWRRGYRSWHRDDGEKTVFPLELVLGLVQGATPLLAGEIGRLMADTGATQQRVLEELARRFGVRLSVSRLREITAALADSMEARREEYQVAKLLELLERAYASRGRYKPVFSVGRDGIFLPLERGRGYQQGAVATISVYDRRGKRLGTVYLASAPEPLQKTLTEQLTSLVQKCLSAWCVDRGRPLPRLCYVTDAGETECGYYAKVLTRLADPRGTGRRLHWYRIIDFFHASQRITAMAEALFGAGPAASAWARRMRKLLRDDPRGISRVLHSAAALRSRLALSEARAEEFRLAYEYLRARSRHMRYAEFKRLRLPIGSGVTEAACKTVFTERLKLSGMGWSREGAQVILTLRVILLSGIWDDVYQAMLKAKEPVNLKTYLKVTSTQQRIAA